MERYNTRQSLAGVALVDDPANAFTLRSDIHTAFDRKTFVFTRKRGAWISHFLDFTSHLGAGYHSVDVEIPAGVHQAILLARLAWAVFPMVSNFLMRGDKRLVKLRGPSPRAEDEKESRTQKLSKNCPGTLCAVKEQKSTKTAERGRGRGQPRRHCLETATSATRRTEYQRSQLADDAARSTGSRDKL
jgi:hypothetical protein